MSRIRTNSGRRRAAGRAPAGRRRAAAPAVGERRSGTRIRQGLLRADTVMPSTRALAQRPRAVPRRRGRGLPAARRRGVPGQPGRRLHPGRRHRRASSRPRPQPPAERSAADRLPLQPAGRLAVPPRRLAAVDPAGAERDAAPSLAYLDGRGTLELRTALADYLNRVRGTAARPENMLICNGFAQGSRLLLQVLAAQGYRRLAVEDPSDNDAARRRGARPGSRWSAYRCWRRGSMSTRSSGPGRTSYW